jgi:hypothetical protein
MPLSTLEHDTLSKSFAISKQLLADIQPKLASLNEIYNAAGTGVGSTLTQAELDELPELSGLQKTTVDDALFAMSGILTSLTNAQAALNQMAARFL